MYSMHTHIYTHKKKRLFLVILKIQTIVLEGIKVEKKNCLKEKP